MSEPVPVTPDSPAALINRELSWLSFARRVLALAGADTGALRDLLLRVSRLADDLPQVAELDLNPVIARPDGVVAVDARIRVTSHRLADPFLRQLPGKAVPTR